MSESAPIPPADPGAGMRARRAAVLEAMAHVLDEGRYILGPEVGAFEREFAAWLGVPATVGVASGTDAIVLALRALGLGPGDEVITVAHTAVATVAAVELAGATPVIVDIERDTCTMDPAAAAAAVTSRTRALLPVHLYGHPAALEPLLALAERHSLMLVEDCAQAHGATWRGRHVGTYGAAATFSFYPTKNLGAMGDGGAVAVLDADTAARVASLREYGWRERYVSATTGINSRLDELQAAILRVRLVGLDADNAARTRIANYYLAALAGAGVQLPVVRPECGPVWHQFVIRHPRREAVRDALRARGIGTLVHYPVAVHQQPAYANRIRCAGLLTETERAAAEVISLPIHPELDESQVARVADAVRDAVREVGAA